MVTWNSNRWQVGDHYTQIDSFPSLAVTIREYNGGKVPFKIAAEYKQGKNPSIVLTVCPAQVKHLAYVFLSFFLF